MEEKRIKERLNDSNEISITVMFGEENLPKDKAFNNLSKDISSSGAKIQSNIFLPVGTLLRIDITLKTIHQKISAFGKVKWIKDIHKNKSYEAGVEFVNSPEEAIKKLRDYISLKQEFGD